MKEGDLKILKVEYLSNHLYDHTQVLSLDLGDQSKVFKYFKWRWPPMEDNLKILKEEYLSNFKLKLRCPNHIFKSSKYRRPPMEDNIKH